MENELIFLGRLSEISNWMTGYTKCTEEHPSMVREVNRLNELIQERIKLNFKENNQSHPSNSIVRQVVPSQDKMDDNNSTKQEFPIENRWTADKTKQELNKEVLKDYGE
jgi:hypothetical protein